LGKISQGDYTPLFHDAAHIYGDAEIEAGVEAHRDTGGRTVLQSLRDVGLGRVGQGQILGGSVQVDSEEGKKFTGIATIDYRERVDAIDTGHYALGFYVGQAARRDGEFVAFVPGSDSFAGILDVAHRETELFSQDT